MSETKANIEEQNQEMLKNAVRSHHLIENKGSRLGTNPNTKPIRRPVASGKWLVASEGLEYWRQSGDLRTKPECYFCSMRSDLRVIALVPN